MTSKNNHRDTDEFANVEDPKVVMDQGLLFVFAGVFIESLWIVFVFYKTPRPVKEAIEFFGRLHLILLLTLGCAVMSGVGLLCYLEGKHHAD